MSTLVVAAIQLPVRPALIEPNIELALTRLADAASRGAELAVLPALWTTGTDHPRPRREAELSAIAMGEVRRIARRHGLIVVGSVLAASVGRFYDQAHVIDSTGTEIGTYRRLHRSVSDGGLVSTGDRIQAFVTARARLGVLISDDVYFPEHAVALALQRVRVLAVLASWTLDQAEEAQRLLAARAIENQCFVVAASGATERPGGDSRGGSFVMDPHGRTIARGGVSDEIVVSTLELEDVHRARRTRPVARNRVPAAYAEAILSASLHAPPEEEALVPTMGRVLSRDEMAAESQALHGEGKKLVFTNGCFDVLHLGHIHYLEAARQQGDALCVGLNTDASVRRLKGAERPLQSEADRAAILASLRCVDYVVLFDEQTPLELIRAVRPDVLVKGGDYQPEAVVGREEVEARGGRLFIAEFVPDHSTTSLIERMRLAEPDDGRVPRPSRGGGRPP